MKFQKSHAGKWVAIKSHKVVDSGRNLKALIRRVGKRKDQSEVGYSLVPNGCIAM